MTASRPRLNAAQRQAVEAFRRGAFVRAPSKARLKEGHRTYKKGWEIRFPVGSRSEADVLRRLLKQAGLDAGRAYRKSATSWILPLYGKESVARFLGWLPPSG